MKIIGVVRVLDTSGRLVVPVEIRILHGIKPGDFLEFYKGYDQLIVRKFEDRCIICGNKKGLSTFKDRTVCDVCVSLAVKRFRAGQTNGGNGMLILTDGCQFDIDKEDVARQADKLEPVRISSKGFYVRIDDKTFAAQNLVAAATNVPQEEVTTLDAYYILAKLGFDVFFNRPQKNRSSGNG